MVRLVPQRVWWKDRGNGMETEGVIGLHGFSVKFVSIKNNESLYIYIIELRIFLKTQLIANKCKEKILNGHI